MKSIRLNKAIRESIRSNIQAAYIEANPAPMYKSTAMLKDELGDAVKHVYLAEAEALSTKVKVAGINENHLIHTPYVYLAEGNSNCFICMEFTPTVVQLNPESAVWLDLTTVKNRKIKRLYEDFLGKNKGQKASKDLFDAWNLKKGNYLADVTAVLDGVNTTKQLLEVWPECAQFIPKGVVNPSDILLPTVSIKSLNAQIKAA